MADLSDAILLATTAHRGQVDKGGQPYILHPLRVMMACGSDEERIAAVLHDVVEDCGVELRLVEHRFGKPVADAVLALTRFDDEDYDAFIERCAVNPIARVVKLADIADNMDLRRLNREPTAADARRQRKYSRARAMLTSSEIRTKPARKYSRARAMLSACFPEVWGEDQSA